MSSLVPEGWQNKSIGEFGFDISDGNYSSKYPKQSEFIANGIPFIRSNNLKNHTVIGSNMRYISPELHADLKKGHLKSGDVLISTRGDIGQVAKVPDLFVGSNINAQLVRINTNGKLCSEYLLHFLTFDITLDAIKNLETGTALKQLPVGKLKQLEILFPPLPEQQKIAQILTSVDEVIEKTQAQIDKLKDLKTAMMQELLTNGIGHVEFKDSPVGRIPVGWDVVSVSNIANVVDSMHLTPSFAESGKPMVRVTEIRNSEVLDISSAVLVNQETFTSFSRNYQPKRGDTLIARVGAYFGATAFIDREYEFCLGQNTASIRPKSIYPEYLFIFLNSENIRSQMEDAVAVGAQPSLSLKAIKELKIGLPTMDEQKKISDSINSVSRRKESIELKLKMLKMTKKALMQDLLTGKVRVNTEQSNSTLAAG
jgi:type I restriction enzyme S subunit